MKIRTILLAGLLSAHLSSGILAAPVITEFMALNRETLNDEDGDSSDWIEIYNASDDPLSLEGWLLTDDPANLGRWQFPSNVWLSAREYLVVFASGKNKTIVPGKLHTNFRLDVAGEFLALLDPQTNIVSQFSPAFPAQFQDVAYGRDRADPSFTGYFSAPTPGAPNSTSGAGFAPEVQFSPSSGTFIETTPFLLTLSVPGSNIVIRYERGTNAPNASSPIYSAPLSIANSTLIRARAFAPGLLPGPISSRSYIALAQQTNIVNFKSTLPVIILHDYGQGLLPMTKQPRTLLMQVFEPVGSGAALTDAPTLSERGTFHLRGDATLGYEKGSFTIELQDEYGDDKDVEMLGMPPESDWLLIAPNNFEPGIINNPLAYQLANDMGEYAPRTRLVEVYLKDDSGIPGPITAADYNGIYTLMEKIKRNPNRVNIDKLEREHVSEPEISGGYLFTIDRVQSGEPPLSAGGVTVLWVEPTAIEMTNPARAPQISYISNYFSAFAAALNGPDYTNATPAWADYIDVNSWITHHIHETLMFNVDALRLSTFLYKPRGGKLTFGPPFDYDRSQGSTDGRDFNPRTWRSQFGDFGTDYFNFTPWWGRLFAAPDFWQQWIDRYQELRGGALSFEHITNTIDRFATEVRPARPRELARWNISPRTGTLTVAGLTHDFGSDGYENEIRWYGFWYSNRLNFMDTQFLARPILSRPSGPALPGDVISIGHQNKPGTALFYTLDGTDPRLPGGAISTTAFSNTGPATITISNNVRIVARAWNSAHRNLTGANNPRISSPWSGAASATLYIAIPPLRITEIMYHPDASDLAEYIEVKNTGSNPLNLAGFRITGGVEFTFPPVQLESGDSGVVVADVAAFQARYGAQPLVLGAYTGRLDNAGEQIVLQGPLLEPILAFHYQRDWYPITDGTGFSLVVVDEHANPDAWNNKAQWRPSSAFHGSPGEGEAAPGPFPNVVINEVLTYPVPPGSDIIELRNLSDTSADVSGWYLTDDFTTPQKYRIPAGTVIPSGAYLTLTPPFALNDLGEEVYLFSANAAGILTGYFDGFTFGAAEQGRTFGRYIISTGAAEFPALMMPTLGADNAPPIVGPVVVSEIHYHPADTSADEFIELQNSSAQDIPLYDPNIPEHTWTLSETIRFQFPPNVTLVAGGHLLIVPFDPVYTSRLQQFRARYGISDQVPVLGPFLGKLDDSGGLIELHRPDAPRAAGASQAQVVPYILVERIEYSSASFWPAEANGFGPSLQRVSPSAYGSDPVNWFAGVPSPGRRFTGGTPPTITVQPQSQTVIAFNDVTFSVTAQGTNLAYQWLFNNRSLRDATNSTLLLSYVQSSQAGLYSVVVMSASGAIISSPATLTLIIPATIHAQPQSVSARLGDHVTFSVSASSSSPIHYQWLLNGQEIPGAVNSVYEIARVLAQDAGVYRVRVTDDVGSFLSLPAMLTLLIPPIIVRDPLSQEVPRGSTVTLSVEVTNTATLPIGYRWRLSGAGTLVSNAFDRRQDFFVVTNVQTTGIFSVAVYNEAQLSGLLSAAATLIPIDDFDQDGMPDAWEVAYGFATNNPANYSADPDGDGSRNLDEYISGTDPRDANSYLQVTLANVTRELQQAHLRFPAVSNRTYSVVFRTNLRTGTWQKLTDVVAASSDRVVEITDTSAESSSRYYRLVTPRQP